MKLVVDAETDKVLGTVMCGPDAAEIMQAIAVALKAGATKATFDNTVRIHPSAAEEFVTMWCLARSVSPASKPKTNFVFGDHEDHMITCRGLSEERITDPYLHIDATTFKDGASCNCGKAQTVVQSAIMLLKPKDNIGHVVEAHVEISHKKEMLATKPLA
ncbi:hypothetical protein ZWY2020_038749 [Hordeum vulgare]|nr:hypothetical protein ZWY2020_038749 [Hordeum vulgare]